MLLLMLLVFFGNFVFYYTFGARAYELIHFDKIMHLLGGLLVALLWSKFFYRRLDSLSSFDFFLTIVGLTILIGVLWEFAEYASQYFPTIHYYFYIGDLRDTLGDLLTDLGGGFIGSLWLLRRR